MKYRNGKEHPDLSAEVYRFCKSQSKAEVNDKMDSSTAGSGWMMECRHQSGNPLKAHHYLQIIKTLNLIKFQFHINYSPSEIRIPLQSGHIVWTHIRGYQCSPKVHEHSHLQKSGHEYHWVRICIVISQFSMVQSYRVSAQKTIQRGSPVTVWWAGGQHCTVTFSLWCCMKAILVSLWSHQATWLHTHRLQTTLLLTSHTYQCCLYLK